MSNNAAKIEFMSNVTDYTHNLFIDGYEDGIAGLDPALSHKAYMSGYSQGFIERELGATDSDGALALE